jgi:hypothetical protein
MARNVTDKRRTILDGLMRALSGDAVVKLTRREGTLPASSQGDTRTELFRRDANGSIILDLALAKRLTHRSRIPDPQDK